MAATVYTEYEGSVIAAPIGDHAELIPAAELAEEYSLTSEQVVVDGEPHLRVKIHARQLKGHYNANDVYGHWVGVALAVPAETDYTAITYAKNQEETMASAGMTTYDHKVGTTEYMCFYMSVDAWKRKNGFWLVSFDGTVLNYIEVDLTDVSLAGSDAPRITTGAWALAYIDTKDPAVGVRLLAEQARCGITIEDSTDALTSVQMGILSRVL